MFSKPLVVLLLACFVSVILLTACGGNAGVAAGSPTASGTSTQPASPPAVTLTATPTTATAGQPITLQWTSTNAVSVTIDPAIPGCTAAPCAVALAGSTTVTPAQTTTYAATATDAAGAAKTASVNVTVTPGLEQIKHIIYFLQENHSFDNYFGQLGAYRVSKGLPNDIDGLPANAVQFDSLGAAVHPYHLPTVCIEPITAAWNPSWGAFDLTGYTLQPGPGVGGNILVGGIPGMDAFVKSKGEITTLDPEYHRVMGYYDQSDIPYYYEAATQFATSDRWFSPVLAGTVANRLYVLAGTSSGHAHDDLPPATGFSQTTVFDVLNQHGVTWADYVQDSTNVLSEFSDGSDQAISSHVFPIANWFTTLAQPTADTDLPEVVFIEHAGNSGLDEHPGDNIQKGAAQAASIINALLASPAWQSSVLIFTYDEFGGWYDHVPAFDAPAPDDIAPVDSVSFDKLRAGDFVHSGFRLPLIVFSPWAKPHFVSHTKRDATSILKLIETRFAVPALTARDAAADDMTEFFDFTAPAWLTPPPLPVQPINGLCDFNQELTGQN